MSRDNDLNQDANVGDSCSEDPEGACSWEASQDDSESCCCDCCCCC